MNVNQRKMFRPRTARNKLNQMGGIMASSPELMQTVQGFQQGGSVDPYFARMAQENLPAIRPGSFADQPVTTIMDFISRANRESGIGQIQQANEMARAGITPQDLARVEAATAANRTANQADDIARVQAATEANRIADMTAERMLAGEDPTMRGPTAADMDEFERATSERLGSEILGDYGLSELGTASESAETAAVEAVTEDVDLPEDSTVTSAAEGADPGAAVREVSPIADSDLPEQTKGAAIADVLKNVLSSDEDPIEVNNLVLEMRGKKDPDKSMSRKERIKQNVALYKELFNEDPEANMKEDAFNLAYLGFAIAAGDSPYALQNIARGTMAGLKKISETDRARRERADRAKLFGLEQTLQEERDIKKEEQRMFELKFGANLQLLRDRYKSDQDLRRFAATQILAENRLNKEIQARIDLQEQKDITAAERDRLNRESLELRNIISNLPESAVMWSQMNPDVDITTDEGQKAALDGMVQIAAKLGTEELGTRKSMSPEDRQYNARTEVLDRDKITPGVYVNEAGNFTEAGIALYNTLLKGPAEIQTPPPGGDGAETTQRITLEPSES